MVGTARERLWPFSSRAAIVATPVAVVVLLLLVAGVSALTGWPGDRQEGIVLIGVFALSLLPLAMLLIDTVAGQRAVLEFRGLRIDFSAALPATGSVGLPSNIGVPGTPLTDSSTVQILDTLRSAVTSEIVVVDLEDGRAWWPTRLLVLCAGGARLGRPAALVFVATEGSVPGRFQGWSPPGELVELLLEVDPRYRQGYDRATAAARELEQVPPGEPPPGPLSLLAAAMQWMATIDSPGSTRRNPLLHEQLLANELGAFEPPDRRVDLAMLRGSFAAFLHSDAIDRSWPAERQLAGFLASHQAYLGVTEDGRYVGLLSREEGTQAVLRALMETRADTG